MPYESKQPNVEPKQELPQHLQHKPVYALPYQGFDGPYPAARTDVRYLSVGLAQWDKGTVSLKILRHTGEQGKWTRQSEELPLHRAIDAVTFLAKVLYGADDGKVVIPAGTLERQEEDLTITAEDQRSGMETLNYEDFLDDAGASKRLKERFTSLRNTLNELASDGKLESNADRAAMPPKGA